MTKQEQIDWLLERMNDAIDNWHNRHGECKQNLPDYLGLSTEGYKDFVCYPHRFAARLLGLEDD